MPPTPQNVALEQAPKAYAAWKHLQLSLGRGLVANARTANKIAQGIRLGKR